MFDGAYPTAGMLSATGDMEDGPFIQVPDEELKKLPSGIMTYAAYGSVSNKLVTFHKKDDLAKGNVFSVPDLSTLKGGGEQVSEDVKTYTQEQVDALVKEAVDKAVEEALAKQTEEAQNSQAFMSVEQVKEGIGTGIVCRQSASVCQRRALSIAKELKEEALQSRCSGDGRCVQEGNLGAQL